MFERFTDRARRVLVLAQEEARLLNHNFLGTEHILLGLIHEGEGVAAKALDSLGISLEAVTEKVEETVGPAGPSTTGSPPFTPRAKKVLELSLREARERGHNYIGTEHLLLGLVREGEGVAAQVLVALGADLDGLPDQLMAMLPRHGGDAAVLDPSIAGVAGDLVEKTDVPVGAAEVLGWEDAVAVLLAGSLVDAHAERTEVDGVVYDTCTYRPHLPPEISLSVAGASVTREAFDDYTRRFLPDAEPIEDLGDGATYSDATGSLRVLTGSTLLVIRVRSHPLAKEVAREVAERILANISRAQQ